ncbi:uncharacterized protein LOC107297644 [Protobothrops mucrosquamatus]|uniref:uncharacterized protein LOC107297644 n=1 Tax=Protobothrops mucrosquamatus TaxID=103944 RepID=UPI000775B005|nr:uncharacterized protein LOC107297644 [Protobothrops mucrosquamatus]
MEPFRSHRGSQTAFLLAGCILSCLLQLVPAEGNLTVVSIPEYPIQEQRVLLNVQNVQKEFEQCEWTQPSGKTIIFTRETKFTPANASQIVQVYENCSLSIKNLRLLDKGKYTVKITFPSTQQQDTKGREIYIGSIFVTFCDEKQLRIRIQPPVSFPGQNATLIAEGIQNKDVFCQWKQITQSGEKDIQDIRQDSKKQTQQQKIIPDRCSLHLIRLIPDYSARFSVYVNISSDQQSTREKGTGEQVTCYRSQTEFQVRKSGSASVKYSAGIIAGALLGSLTWTSSLSLLPLLFGVLSSFFPEC